MSVLDAGATTSDSKTLHSTMTINQPLYLEKQNDRCVSFHVLLEMD